MEDSITWKNIITQEQKIRQLSEDKRRKALQDLQQTRELLEEANATINEYANKCKALEECHKKNTINLRSTTKRLIEVTELNKNLNYEIDILSQENEKLKSTLTNRYEDLKNANSKVNSLNNELSKAKFVIANQQQEFADLKKEHKLAMQQASNIIEEYFRYKFLDSPLQAELSINEEFSNINSSDTELEDDHNFMQQLEFLENNCVEPSE